MPEVTPVSRVLRKCASVSRDPTMTDQTDVDDRAGERRDETAESEIARFFSGSKVLITVGLGFLGKLLIEKLLRCCPDVATLYVFVRGKNGMNPQERVEQLYDMPLYERLRREQPDFLRKLTVIESDLELESLGLSPQDRSKLLDANVIFHGSAIVRFNQKLRTMTNVNVRATKQVLELAREMANLKAFVHLSTVFAHSPISSIEEKHYPPPMQTDELLSLVEILSDSKLVDVTPILTKGWPGAVTFTKAVAEDTVLRYSDGGIPACIVRPSIVTSTWKEPIVGWADSVYGPVGLLAGCSLGLLRTMHCCAEKNVDFVPADYVTSSLIAAAWDTGVRSIAKKLEAESITPDVERVPVYNHVSSCQRPITWATFRKHVRDHRTKVPGAKDARLQRMFWNSRLWVHRILVYLLHLLPAVMVDAAAILTGREPRWRKIYGLIDAHLTATSYFTTRQWYFDNEATVKLWARLSAVDRTIFAFDMDSFNWGEYAKRMAHGVRAFVGGGATPWRTVTEGLAEYAE